MRIYRRDEYDANLVVGTVERAETQEQKPFHSLSALNSLLSARHTERPADEQRRVRPATADALKVEKKTG